MSNVIIFAAFIAFSIFFVAGRYRRYAAMAGWTCIVLNLISEIPAFIQEANFLYPALALLSIPFLFIMVKNLECSNPVADRLSVSAAVATVIFVPFALVTFLQDTLVRIVITLVFDIVTNLGHHPSWAAWDIIMESGFYNQIILGCTAILAVALVLGVIAGIPNTPFLRKAVAAILVVPLIFFLNLFRVAGVFIAVSDRWFDGLPDPTGTGNANFFWAHNVIAEFLAILFLFALIRLLFCIVPGLSGYVWAVWGLIAEGIKTLVSGRKN